MGMKSTGIVRKIDELGRIVVPKELRRTLDIDNGDPMEIYVDGEYIMLKRYAPFCTFCQTSSKDLTPFKGRLVCDECVNDLSHIH